jgi:hypothetical protein
MTNALFTIIQEQYGERLTPEQLAEVRKGIEANVKIAETLSQFPLRNGDEPFSVFTPYRAWER